MPEEIFRKFYLEKKTTAEIARDYSVTEASISMIMMDPKNRDLRNTYIQIYRQELEGAA